MYGYIELDENGKILTGVLKKLTINFNAYNDKDPFPHSDAYFFYHSRLTFKSDNVNDLLDCLQFLTRKKKYYTGRIFVGCNVYEITSNNVNIVPASPEITKLFTQDIKAISTTALQNYYVLASDKDYIPYMDGFALDTHERVRTELLDRGISSLPSFNMIACDDISKFENLDFTSALSSTRNPFDFNLIRLIPTLDLKIISPEIDLVSFLSAREEINELFQERIYFDVDYFSLLSYFKKEPLTACYFDISKFLTILKGVID